MWSVTRVPRLLVACSAAVILGGGCAGGDGDDATGTEATGDEPTGDEPTGDDAAGDEASATTEGEPDDAAEADDAAVGLADTELGAVLVDGDGMTLYLFDVDDQGPSQCAEDCAATWPPLVTDGEPVAGDGIDAGLLGTVERDEGELQVTYDGWPLYHFVGDDQGGDIAGQAVQDVWWVLDADGTPLRDTAESDRAGY